MIAGPDTSMASLASRAAWSGAPWMTRTRGKAPEIMLPTKESILRAMHPQREHKGSYAMSIRTDDFLPASRKECPSRVNSLEPQP